MSSVVISGDTSGTITLQAPAAAGSSVITLGANSGTNILDTNTPAFRNRIINGAMMIDQRNAGASVTPASGDYTVDRFQYFASQTSKASVQRSTTAPVGFVNSALITSLSAYTVGASEVFGYRQPIEGLNCSDFGWGTANATAVTLSFWVRSSLTGTFGGSILNSAQNRSYPFSYTISSANTWEQKTVSLVGDTSGTWLTTNGIGAYISFSLGAGSTFSGSTNTWAGAQYYAPTGAVSVVGTSGATFYITGVQLEKGSTATSFDYRPYGTELALCQRYTVGYSGGAGYRLGFGFSYSTTGGYVGFNLPVTMRTGPSIEGTASLMTFNDGISGYNATNAPTINNSQENFVGLSITGATGMTANRPAQIYFTGASSKLILSSEL